MEAGKGTGKSTITFMERQELKASCLLASTYGKFTRQIYHFSIQRVGILIRENYSLKILITLLAILIFISPLTLENLGRVAEIDGL